MGGVCKFLGVLSVIGAAIGFLPLLGWFNWIHLPFAGFAFLVSALVWGLAGSEGTRAGGRSGVIMSVAAIVVGSLRLMLGGGVL